MSWKSVLYKYNPAVPKRLLLIIAGSLWTLVGAFLCWRAYGWLELEHETITPVFAVTGIVVAVTANRFLLAKSARRIVDRISLLPDRACLFAFTPWRGYFMIGGMITMGVLLRNSAFPRHYLALLYGAMGGALVLSSFVFYNSYWSDTDVNRNLTQ